jgi:hypothetical protein
VGKRMEISHFFVRCERELLIEPRLSSPSMLIVHANKPTSNEATNRSHRHCSEIESINASNLEIDDANVNSRRIN